MQVLLAKQWLPSWFIHKHTMISLARPTMVLVFQEVYYSFFKVGKTPLLLIIMLKIWWRVQKDLHDVYNFTQLLPWVGSRTLLTSYAYIKLTQYYISNNSGFVWFKADIMYIGVNYFYRFSRVICVQKIFALFSHRLWVMWKMLIRSIVWVIFAERQSNGKQIAKLVHNNVVNNALHWQPIKN